MEFSRETPQHMNTGSARSSKNKNRILVAIDFGTTYSAIAWVRATGRGGTQPQGIIQNWPGRANTEDKVPTLLSNDIAKWGFRVKDHKTRYEWFKLEQDPNYTKPELLRNYPSSTIIPDSEEKVEELITKFLEYLRIHAVEKVKEYFGGGEALFRSTTWEYIITVPAMWPEPAQNITERCAIAAGMADDAPLKIITEPEAAGIFALDAMCREWFVEVHDTFVICDAGGGTVDLISYTISELQPSPVLDEAAPGVGKLYGSSFLDRNFNDWLTNRFAGYHRWTEDYQEIAMIHWESQIKREFGGDPQDTYTFRVLGLPDDPARSIRNGVLEMTLAEVKSIFDPIVDKIVGLVKDQITAAKIKSNREVKTVLLAGGFGSNAYLKARIQEAVGQGIEVRKMTNSTTAIVRGALIRGLAAIPRTETNIPRPTIVRARFASSHIGTIALEKYNALEHGLGRNTVSGGIDGGKRIEVMRWLLDKNAIIEDNKGFDFPFVFDQLVSDVERKGGKIDQLNLQIYYCQEDERPRFPDIGGEENPEHQNTQMCETDYGVGKCKPLVMLPADFNQIPKKFLIKQQASDGQMWYKIPFMIENEDGSIIRKTYGSVKADPLNRMRT